MEQEKHNNFFLSFFNSIYKIVEKAGFIKTIFVCLLCIFFSFSAFIVMNPKLIFEQFVKYQEEVHKQKINTRMKQNPIIMNILKDLRNETDAHRCWVVEAHNGVESLGGINFLWGKMTYEVCDDNIKSAQDDYNDFSLCKYPMVDKLVKEGYWSGTVDDLMKIDKALSYKILVNDTKSLCLVTLYGSNSYLGWLGVSFTTEEGFNAEKIEAIVRKYSYKVAYNLDFEKLSK